MNQPMEAPIVEVALKGHKDALAFVRRIALVLHGWDDLADHDAAVSDADLNTMFTQALIDLPRNSFYLEHFNLLNPVLLNSILNWRIANELERQEEPSDDDLRISFVARSSYIDIVTMSSLIIGGMDWAVQCGVELRRWAHGETFDGYLINLAAEKAARKGNTNVL